jgi:hypothetical protein
MLGFDFREEKPTVEGFVTSQKYNWTFLLEPGGATASRYQADAIPTHIFIDKQGYIKDRISSALPRSYMEAELQKLVGQ